MIKKRAIYVGDVRYDQCPVFELNEETGFYEMIVDHDFRYPKEIMDIDEDWLCFEFDTEEDKATFII